METRRNEIVDRAYRWFRRIRMALEDNKMENETVNNDEELESRRNEIVDRAHRWISELPESFKTLVDEASKSKIAMDHLDAHAICIELIFEQGEPKGAISLTRYKFMNSMVEKFCKGKAKLVWDLGK